MKGKPEKKAERWGAELAFTERFLEQRPTHSCRLLFWSDWSGSEAPSNLIVLRLVVKDHRRYACATGGSGCTAEGHRIQPPSPAAFHRSGYFKAHLSRLFPPHNLQHFFHWFTERPLLLRAVSPSPPPPQLLCLFVSHICENKLIYWNKASELFFFKKKKKHLSCHKLMIWTNWLYIILMYM